MASGGDDSFKLPLEQLSNQFLMCPLCLEQYRVPKVLPCQHTFCLICLRQYVAARGLDMSIPCPMCKELCYIPENDVSKFKSNFMIISLLHFVESSASPSGSKSKPESQLKKQPTSDSQSLVTQHSCDACNERSSLASFCQPCQMWLCKICTKAHGKLPSTSSHLLLSSEEVDSLCKAKVEQDEKALSDLIQRNNESFDFIQTQIQLLPENLTSVKERIEAAAEEAHKVVRSKANELVSQATQFQHEKQEMLSQKVSRIEDRKSQLDSLIELLQTVRISQNGYENQKAVNTVEEYLNGNTGNERDERSETNAFLNLIFTAYGNNLTDLKNLEMGHVGVIASRAENSIDLIDRPLGVHKIASLVDREYISALAITKFADKFVVTSNQSVMVFKPDSRVPKSFLSPLSPRNVTKPWGIAYCEESRRIFVTEAGTGEGEGAIVSYSNDGANHVVIASGLTLPRGIAVYRGYLFVCDQIDKCVYILTVCGKIVRVLKKTPDGKCIFNGPMFIAVGKNGTMAVSDNCTSIKIFDKDCNLLFTYYSRLPESQFWDVHVMHNGIIIACDWKHGLHKIGPNFEANGLINMETNTLREPSALAALESGNSVYIGTCGGEIYSAI